MGGLIEYKLSVKGVLKNSGEEVKIISYDTQNDQFEIQYDDGSYKVVNGDEVVDFEYPEGEIDCVIKEKTNAELHKELLNSMHDTYKRKNADYGNSFEEQFAEYGLLSSLIRLDDKMRRLKQLYSNEAQVKDESIRDTLMDMANYATMTVMELDKQNGNNQ